MSANKRIVVVGNTARQPIRPVRGTGLNAVGVPKSNVKAIRAGAARQRG